MQYRNYLIALVLLACGACGGAPTTLAAQERVAVTDSGRQLPGTQAVHAGGHRHHHHHKSGCGSNRCRSNCNWNFSFASYSPVCAPVYQPVYVPACRPVCVPMVYPQPVYVARPCFQVVQPVYVAPPCGRSVGFSWGFSFGR